MDTVSTIMQWYGRANPLSAPASALIHAMLQARGGARPSAASALRHPLLARAILRGRMGRTSSVPDLGGDLAQTTPAYRSKSYKQSVQAAAAYTRSVE